MHGADTDKWTNELEDSLSKGKNRDYLDSNLEKFSVDRQAEDIEKLM